MVFVSFSLYIHRVCFYFIRFPSHSGPLLPSRPLLSAFVCEWNLMTVYKRPESLRREVSVVGCDRCGEVRVATRGLIGGPPEWAAGEPLAAQPPTPPFVCTRTPTKPETARTVTSPRRENNVPRIRACPRFRPRTRERDGRRREVRAAPTCKRSLRKCGGGVRASRPIYLFALNTRC